MKFSQIIKESLEKTALRKVRIKVDPAMVSVTQDFANVDGYEGYILAEGVGKLKILVLSPDMPIEDIPVEFIEAIAEEDKLETFEELKSFILSEMIKCGTQEGDPILCNVASSNNLCDIETFLKQEGYTDEKLSELYKSFIMHDETLGESTFYKGMLRRGIGKAAAIAKGAIETPFKAVDVAHDVINKGNVGRVLDPIIKWGDNSRRSRWTKDDARNKKYGSEWQKVRRVPGKKSK